MTCRLHAGSNEGQLGLGMPRRGWLAGEDHPAVTWNCKRHSVILCEKVLLHGAVVVVREVVEGCVAVKNHMDLKA